jgi:hypothetical protein
MDYISAKCGNAGLAARRTLKPTLVTEGRKA